MHILKCFIVVFFEVVKCANRTQVPIPLTSDRPWSTTKHPIDHDLDIASDRLWSTTNIRQTMIYHKASDRPWSTTKYPTDRNLLKFNRWTMICHSASHRLWSATVTNSEYSNIFNFVRLNFHGLNNQVHVGLDLVVEELSFFVVVQFVLSMEDCNLLVCPYHETPPLLPNNSWFTVY